MRGLSHTAAVIVGLVMPVFVVLSPACAQKISSPKVQGIIYRNVKYGFTFSLPSTWKGYSIGVDRWQSAVGEEVSQSGPQVTIRHPRWKDEDPRQDIVIMVFTLAQWDSLQRGDFSVSAASIGPGEFGRNHKYVFAEPPRLLYNDEAVGWKEVVDILNGNPLHPF